MIVLTIQEMVEKARMAQKIFEGFSQKQVDLAVRAVGKAVFDNAEHLARLAVDETGMGVYEDKVQKNKGKGRLIWNHLKNKKSVGVIGRDENTGIVSIAKPMGLIGAVTPVTNPIVTPMSNAMFALKGRNAIIIAPHPRARKCGARTVELINKAINLLGAPEGLIQILEEPSKELTVELMGAVDIVVATGGMGMVKAAYSSGRPAYGVGAGNVQVIFDREIDFNDASRKVIAGRQYDNGIICSSEQAVIFHEDDFEKVIRAFKDNGAFYMEEQKQIDALRKVLFIGGIINKDVVGQSAIKISRMAGINIPENTKVLLARLDSNRADLLRKEKMCPVLAAFTYSNFDQAIEIAQTNLNIEGKGHTCAIHSNNREHIEAAGKRLPVSRLVVNQSSSRSAGGSFFNGFAPTTTLGCGSWGNNSISENLDYKHLINIHRIGYPLEGKKVPSDEELWACAC